MKSSLQPKPALIVLLAILVLAASSTAAGAVNPLSGSQNHGLGLQTDGSVCAAGDNLYGMLGDGTAVDRKTPVRVAGENIGRQNPSGSYPTLLPQRGGTGWGGGGEGGETDASR